MRKLLLGLLVVAVPASLATAQAATSWSGTKTKSAKTTICHRTASATKPYVRVTVAKAALKGHLRHASDIIPAPAGACPSVVLSPTQGGQILTTTLSGAAEVPGPGDPDGTGTATIRLRLGEGRICYLLNVSQIMLPATAAHIHVGTSAQAGAVVVPLNAPDASGVSSGCANVSRTLVAAIAANSHGYYVNVHTSDLPNGAVRGQL